MNSPLADEMGIIIGTSHHEPMARNHQEYARNRKLYGEWNYQRNKEGVERFFREFGAIQTPFFTITRGNLSLLYRAWLKIKERI